LRHLPYAAKRQRELWNLDGEPLTFQSVGFRKNSGNRGFMLGWLGHNDFDFITRFDFTMYFGNHA